MNKETFLEYFKTIFLTMLFTAFVVLVIILFMVHQIVSENEIKKDVEDNSLDLNMINLLIEKNKYLREEHPENYKIDSRLGFLYEVKQDYKSAEIEYKSAISKVPYSEFKPYYDLSFLYIKEGRLEDSQVIMDDLGEKPIKKLIKYKAEIYTKLGDKYYDKAEYEDAAFKYQKAIGYYEVLKKENEVKKLQENLASSYVYLADEKVKEMKIDEAIIYINKARLIIKAPILTYKLGVLLSQTEPELACQCFDEVFKKEPALINYEEYYSLLADLADKAAYEDEPAKVNLYEYKIKKLQKYYSENLIAVSDLEINHGTGQIKINPLFRKYSASINISLKNISKYEINSLYLEFVFKNGDEVVERFFKQIIEEKIPLESGETLPFIYIKTTKLPVVKDYPKEITVDVYVSKKEDSRKLLLDQITIKEPPKKPNKIKLWLKQFCLKYIYPHFGAGFFG